MNIITSFPFHFLNKYSFLCPTKKALFFFFLNVIFISIISVCLILWYEKIDWKIHESSFHSNFIIGEVKCKRETQRKQKIVLKKTFHNHMGIVPLKLYISVYLCPFSNCLCVLFFFNHLYFWLTHSLSFAPKQINKTKVNISFTFQSLNLVYEVFFF